MKKSLLLLPIAAFALTGCGKVEELNYQVYQSTQSINNNRCAVLRSTEVIRENGRLIDGSTKAIQDNQRALEQMER